MCSILSRFEAQNVSLCLTAVAKRVACTFFKSSVFLATPLAPLCCLTTLLRTSRSSARINFAASSTKRRCQMSRHAFSLLFRSMAMMRGQCHHTVGGCRQHPVLYRAAKATRSRAWRRRILGVPSRRGRVVPAPSSRHRFATHSLATPAIGALLYLKLLIIITCRRNS